MPLSVVKMDRQMKEARIYLTRLQNEKKLYWVNHQIRYQNHILNQLTGKHHVILPLDKRSSKKQQRHDEDKIMCASFKCMEQCRPMTKNNKQNYKLIATEKHTSKIMTNK